MFVHVEILSNILDAIKSLEVYYLLEWEVKQILLSLWDWKGNYTAKISWTAWAVSNKVHERPQGNINWHNKQREKKFIKCNSISSTTHE